MQLYDFIESEDWEKVYEHVNAINANPEFFKGIDKYELAEVSYCAWMLLDEMGRYVDFDQTFSPDLEDALYRAYLCYQKKFADDDDFTCWMGYMIRKFPENFPSLGDHLSVEAFGKSLMEKAYQNEPNNPFIRLMHLKGGNWKRDEEVVSLAKSYVAQKFKDCKGLLDYFQEVL